MTNGENSIYGITVKSFIYGGVSYNVAIVPEMYPEADHEEDDIANEVSEAAFNAGLDFTGSYHVILISSAKGTSAFTLEPDSHTHWVADIKGMDPGLIDELDLIIQEMRKS